MQFRQRNIPKLARNKFNYVANRSYSGSTSSETSASYIDTSRFVTLNTEQEINAKKTFKENVAIQKDLNVSGNGYFDNIQADGDLHVMGSITTEGNIIADGEVTAYSDRRLKDNIQPLANRGNVQPVAYTKDGKQSIGFIAQDVKELYPELVTEDERGYLSVNYMQFCAVLQAQVIELQERLKRLENGTE